jgi:hypothetical protein
MEDYTATRPEPILATLSDPLQEYFCALSLFEKRIAVGTADYDTLVPSASATICAGSRTQLYDEPGWKALSGPGTFHELKMA